MVRRTPWRSKAQAALISLFCIAFHDALSSVSCHQTSSLSNQQQQNPNDNYSLSLFSTSREFNVIANPDGIPRLEDGEWAARDPENVLDGPVNDLPHKSFESTHQLDNNDQIKKDANDNGLLSSGSSIEPESLPNSNDLPNSPSSVQNLDEEQDPLPSEEVEEEPEPSSSEEMPVITKKPIASPEVAIVPIQSPFKKAQPTDEGEKEEATEQPVTAFVPNGQSTSMAPEASLSPSFAGMGTSPPAPIAIGSDPAPQADSPPSMPQITMSASFEPSSKPQQKPSSAKATAIDASRPSPSASGNNFETPESTTEDVEEAEASPELDMVKVVPKPSAVTLEPSTSNPASNGSNENISVPPKPTIEVSQQSVVPAASAAPVVPPAKPSQNSKKKPASLPSRKPSPKISIGTPTPKASRTATPPRFPDEKSEEPLATLEEESEITSSPELIEDAEPQPTQSSSFAPSAPEAVIDSETTVASNQNNVLGTPPSGGFPSPSSKPLPEQEARAPVSTFPSSTIVLSPGNEGQMPSISPSIASPKLPEKSTQPVMSDQKNVPKMTTEAEGDNPKLEFTPVEEESMDESFPTSPPLEKPQPVGSNVNSLTTPEKESGVNISSVQDVPLPSSQMPSVPNINPPQGNQKGPTDPLIVPDSTYTCINFGKKNADGYDSYDKNLIVGETQSYDGDYISKELPVPYQSQIFGKRFTYTLQLPKNSATDLVLGFAEIYSGICDSETVSNSRIFTVRISGGKQIVNVAKNVGCGFPYQAKFLSVSPRQKAIDISFQAVKNNAMLSVVCYAQTGTGDQIANVNEEQPEPTQNIVEQEDDVEPTPTQAGQVESVNDSTFNPALNTAPEPSPSNPDVPVALDVSIQSSSVCYNFGPAVDEFLSAKVPDLNKGIKKFNDPSAKLTDVPYPVLYTSHIFGDSFKLLLRTSQDSLKTLVLYFAEIYSPSCSIGARTFLVTYGTDRRVVDVFGEAGCNSPLNVRLPNLSPNEDGTIEIGFKSISNFAMLSGFCVIDKEAGDSQDVPISSVPVPSITPEMSPIASDEPIRKPGAKDKTEINKEENDDQEPSVSASPVPEPSSSEEPLETDTATSAIPPKITQTPDDESSAESSVQPSNSPFPKENGLIDATITDGPDSDDSIVTSKSPTSPSTGSDKNIHPDGNDGIELIGSSESKDSKTNSSADKSSSPATSSISSSEGGPIHPNKEDGVAVLVDDSSSPAEAIVPNAVSAEEVPLDSSLPEATASTDQPEILDSRNEEVAVGDSDESTAPTPIVPTDPQVVLQISDSDNNSGVTPSPSTEPVVLGVENNDDSTVGVAPQPSVTPQTPEVVITVPDTQTTPVTVASAVPSVTPTSPTPISDQSPVPISSSPTTATIDPSPVIISPVGPSVSPFPTAIVSGQSVAPSEPGTANTDDGATVTVTDDTENLTDPVASPSPSQSGVTLTVATTDDTTTPTPTTPTPIGTQQGIDLLPPVDGEPEDPGLPGAPPSAPSTTDTTTGGTTTGDTTTGSDVIIVAPDDADQPGLDNPEAPTLPEPVSQPSAVPAVQPAPSVAPVPTPSDTSEVVITPVTPDTSPATSPAPATVTPTSPGELQGVVTGTPIPAVPPPDDVTIVGDDSTPSTGTGDDVPDIVANPSGGGSSTAVATTSPSPSVIVSSTGAEEVIVEGTIAPTPEARPSVTVVVPVGPITSVPENNTDVIQAPENSIDGDNEEEQDLPTIIQGEYKGVIGTRKSGNGFSIGMGVLGSLLVLALLLLLLLSAFRGGGGAYSYSTNYSPHKPSDYNASQAGYTEDLEQGTLDFVSPYDQGAQDQYSGGGDTVESRPYGLDTGFMYETPAAGSLGGDVDPGAHTEPDTQAEYTSLNLRDQVTLDERDSGINTPMERSRFSNAGYASQAPNTGDYTFNETMTGYTDRAHEADTMMSGDPTRTSGLETSTRYDTTYVGSSFNEDRSIVRPTSGRSVSSGKQARYSDPDPYAYTTEPVTQTFAQTEDEIEEDVPESNGYDDVYETVHAEERSSEEIGPIAVPSPYERDMTVGATNNYNTGNVELLPQPRTYCATDAFSQNSFVRGSIHSLERPDTEADITHEQHSLRESATDNEYREPSPKVAPTERSQISNDGPWPAWWRRDEQKSSTSIGNEIRDSQNSERQSSQRDSSGAPGKENSSYSGNHTYFTSRLPPTKEGVILRQSQNSELYDPEEVNFTSALKRVVPDTNWVRTTQRQEDDSYQESEQNPYFDELRKRREPYVKSVANRLSAGPGTFSMQSEESVLETARMEYDKLSAEREGLDSYQPSPYVVL